MKQVLFIPLLFWLILTGSCNKQRHDSEYNKAKDLLYSTKPYNGKIWVLGKYEVNGIDSTKYIIKGNRYTNYQNESIKFVQKFSHGNKDQLRSESINHYYYVELELKSKYLSFSFGGSYECTNYYCERNLFNPEFASPEGESWQTYVWWKIEKLTKTELVLTSYTSKNYRIELRAD